MNKPVFLSSGGIDAMPAVTLGQGFPKEVNGLPASYYWRKSLRDGAYKHPTAGWEMSVTPDYRHQLASKFKKTAESGLKFPVLRKHDGMGVGFLLDVRNSGEWLEELHQYLGEDARVEALRNRVSIGIHPNVPDARGNQWGEGIYHSAIVPDPVVAGQGEAIRVMSSSGQHDTIDVLTLADSTGAAAMSVIQLSQEQFDKLKTALGGGDNVTPDTLVETITTTLTANAQAVEANATKLLSITAERDGARTKLSETESKVREFSASATAPDPIVLNDRGENFAESLGILRDAGHVTPASAEAFAKLSIEDNAPSVRLLSASSGKPPLYKAILAALKLNKVMQFGNSAGLQVLNPPTEEPKTAEQREADLEAELKRRLARIGKSAA